MKKKNIILATTISTIPLLSMTLIPFLTINNSNVKKVDTNININRANYYATGNNNTDFIEEPFFYNNFLESTAIFNINNFKNIQGEENYYSSEVSSDVILRLVLNNITDIFGSSLDAQNFKKHLATDSFKIINFPKSVCVIFTLDNVILASNNAVGKKEYQIILTGFRTSPEAEFTWLIYTLLAIVPGIVLFFILFLIVRRSIKKKSCFNGQVVDGEYVIY